MSSEWQNVQLSELITVKHGFAFKGEYFSDDATAYQLVTPGNFSIGGGFQLGKGKYYKGPIPTEYVLRTGDIVVTMTDLSKAADTLGFAAVIPETQDTTWLHNQRVGLVELKSGAPITLSFLNYLMRSKDYRHWVVSSATGSTVKHTAPNRICSYRFLLPSIDEQKQIASTLAALDDRISLLRETSTTLESIAQALYKSWFVDFDPVRAKQQGTDPQGMDATTAALFPDSFEDSELGEVPRGWRVTTLGEICAVTIGGLWGNDERDDAELKAAISLRGVDLEHLRIEGFAKNAPVRWVKVSAMEKRRLGENEVLIASSGAGPCGRPLWAGAGFELLYGMPVIFSNFVKRLDCGSPARAIYIDRLLAEMRETREIWNYINGTSIPNLDDKLLLATKKVIVPDDAVLSAFEGVARTIYQRLYSQEAQTLATLRDTLLPRLISGQLRMTDVPQLFEETVA